MNNLKSVTKAVKTIKKNNIPLVLMQCTSIYPTPLSKVNLSKSKIV